MAVISTLLHFSFTPLTKTHRTDNEKMVALAATKTVRQRRPSTQYPPREMCAQQFKLSTEAFDFYGRALFQRRTSRMFLRKSCISTEQAHFFYKKEQVIDNTKELDFHGRSSRQSTQRSQIFLRNDLSLLYRTVRFIQNTTMFFFKER